MRSRTIRHLGCFTLAASAVLIAGQAAAASRPAFTAAPQPTGAYQVRMPRNLSSAPVTVMVELTGDSVAVANANVDLTMSSAQKAQFKSTLRQQQAPIEARVQALGGRVGRSYQHSYNGLRVSIPGNKLAQLAATSGVKAIHTITPKAFNNIHGVPLIGAPQAWAGAPGFHGEGIKVAIIDTGIDYTHADFGGPGTVDAYQAALATDTSAPDPALIGSSAPRIKGGVDLVGDDYNADPGSSSYQPVPHPDSNPLDCNGHGTHVAGTAAGSGVLATGATYTGAYNANTVSGNSWIVGPGVAPKADIYSIRVFGCAGSTDVVVDAIEWAMDHDMDVINMSLGSAYGGADDPDAVAADNAAMAGVIVVASAGNAGPNPYIVGAPSTSNRAISVAAIDSTDSFPAANIALSTGSTFQAINANGISVAGLSNVPVVVLLNGSGGISLGCDPNEYLAANVVGKIAVTARGTCARVARAVFGQKAGAVAVIMVNNANTFPPFEGPITSNPDTGEQYTVTIPFLGVPSSRGATLLAANGGTASLTDANIANPGFLSLASFSSGGPRSGDSGLKPDVAAPGVSIQSAGMGTGKGVAIISGTSMASPHTAGAAALVRQAHPTWKKVVFWKAALANTADASLVGGYKARVAGAGLVQVQLATSTQVVATANDETASLSFGMVETKADYLKTKSIKLKNFSSSPVTFTVGHSNDAGAPRSLSLPGTVTVPANGTVSFDVTLNVPAATMGDSSVFHDVAGLISLAPQGGANFDVTLNVPYYLVPQAISEVHTALNAKQLVKKGAVAATVTNDSDAPAIGTADWYSWGLTDPADTADSIADVSSVGAQSFPGVVAFGVNLANRFSNPAALEIDLYVDVNGDNVDDYVVVNADFGSLTAGSPNGQAATAVFDLRTGAGSIQFLTGAYTNGTSLVMPVLVSQLCASGSPCVSSGNPRIAYHAYGFGPDGSFDAVNGTARYNVFSPAISDGMYDELSPGQSAAELVTINQVEIGQTPPLGVMVLYQLNSSKKEAQTIVVSP